MEIQASAGSISRVAVAKSNQEAKRLYHIEPFKQEDGQLRAVGQQSVWDALTSSGGYDLTAKVTLDEHGSVVGVEVRMLIHPSTEQITNLDDFIGPDMEREKRLGIPEVMPK